MIRYYYKKISNYAEITILDSSHDDKNKNNLN